MTQHLTNPSWRPYIVLAVGLLAVSSSSVMIRLAQTANAGSLVIAAWRVGLAALILTPIVLNRYRADVQRLTHREIGLGLLSGLLLGIHFGTWVTSLEYTSVISSVVLVSTNPLWVALASPFLLRESLSRVTLTGIITAIAGVVLISAASDVGMAARQNAPLLGNALALVGAFGVAGYFMIGRRLRGSMSLIPYIWLTYGSAAIVLIGAALLAGQPFTGLSPDAYFWMTLVALFPQLIGHSSYNYALGYLSAAYVSLVVLGEPIGSTLLAAIFLHEQPVALQLMSLLLAGNADVGQTSLAQRAVLQLVGSALILLALVVASREEARVARQRTQAAAPA